MSPVDVRMWRQRRVELVRQTEMAECGLASLSMVAAFHGLQGGLGSLRQRFSPSLRGATLKSLVGIADKLGLATRAVKVPLEDLEYLEMPAILHWDLSHFVVLEKVRRRRALIHDPAGHSRWTPLSEVSRRFSGVALELRPRVDFNPGAKSERLRVRQLWSRLTGLHQALAQILLLSLVLQIYVLAAPYYMQLAVDTAVPALDVGLITALALGFATFALVNAVASLLRAFVIMSAATQLGYGLSLNVARQLFRLPVDWFERRHVGDILSRFQSVTPIQQALTTGPITALLDGLLAVGTLVMIFFYSGLLGVLSLITFAVYAALRLAVFPLQRRAQEQVIVTAARSQTSMIETVRGIATLRLYNKEASRLAVWQTAFAEATNATFRSLRLTAWQDFAGLQLFTVEGVVALAIAFSLVVDGGFSLGMVFAFAAYKTQFVTKGMSFIEQALLFRMLRLHLERISDIALATEDPGFEIAPAVPHRLEGRLEVKSVSYRYSPADPLVLDGVNLQVLPGDHIAITGPSGGGKSTLARVLLGLVQPEAGELLIDGLPVHVFGRTSYREQIAAVLQDDHLFGGTLTDNIALFDDQPDMHRIIEAASAAAIHEDVMRMPMRYETLVGDMGSALSGGQKQRLLLARALYRKPRLLVLDEGTSHLDSEHERRVNASVSALGITRIVIAHRRETIAAADRVYVLRDGKLHAATPG